MGTISPLRGGPSVTLDPDTLVGRGPACQFVIPEPEVSLVHARLRWGTDGWSVRDLGSQNGTWVNGHRIDPGVDVRLARDDRIGFGTEALTWILADAEPPLGRAICVKTGDQVCFENGLLFLPSSDNPCVTIYRNADDVWLAEAGSVVFEVSDGQQIGVDGEPWTLLLTATPTRTLEAEERTLLLRDTTLRFEVSRNEERIDLALLANGAEVAVPSRKSHYLLLVLARQRLQDKDEGLPERERGWIERDTLCRMLRADRTTVNKDVCHIRRQLAGMGVVDSWQIVDVAADSRRIGTGRLLIA